MRIWFPLCIGMFLASPSLADWNYVRWGMTKHEAIAASKGEARAIKEEDDVVCGFTGQVPFAVIERKVIADFEFLVTFCSPGGVDRVTSVALSPSRGSNIPSLRRAMLSQYGAGARDGNTMIWNDMKTGNTISFWTIGDDVARIEYKKLGKSGL